MFAAVKPCPRARPLGLTAARQNALYAATASETVASRLQLGRGEARAKLPFRLARFVCPRAPRSVKPPSQTVNSRRAACQPPCPAARRAPTYSRHGVDSGEDNTISKQKKATEKFMAS